MIFINFMPISSGESEEFYYQIGHHKLNIDDVKHGILRGNKKHQGSKFSPYKDGDSKLKLSIKEDLRILLFFKEENILP